MYPYIKLLHIFGGILFLGNIVVTAVWKTLADRTSNPQVIAYAQRLVNKTDGFFTAPGALLVLVTGVTMAMIGGPALYHTPWVMWGAGLFSLAGVVWLAVLVPVQRKQARLADGFANGGNIPDAYWRLARRWAVFGSIATVLAVMTLWAMVVRPT
jgi:uncharacterized membrane protein